MANSKSNEQTMNFLIATIPGLKIMGSAAKERIISYFKEKTFKPGEELEVEGVKAEKAYIIREGECKLVSTRPQSSAQQSRGGYLSKTT